MRWRSVRERRASRGGSRAQKGSASSVRDTGAGKRGGSAALPLSTWELAPSRRGLGERWLPRAHHSVHRFELTNGLRVIAVRQPHLHTASLSVLVNVGSRHESERDNGISHLLEHMLFRGCARYPSAYALNRAIEELGGTLHGATHADSTLFELTLPPDNLGAALAILGELFASPSFCELRVEKRIVREEVLEYLDEAGQEVDPDNLSRQLMFAGHPLGMTITGSLQNLERFGVADLRAHLRRHYVASNLVVCVAGCVDPQAVAHAVQRHFGTLPKGVPSGAQAAPKQPSEERLRFVESLGPQTDVRLSFSTFGARDPRYLTLELLLRVIDDGMSTRLHRRICEELGLAYEVFASLEPYEECGVLDIGATVQHDKAQLLVRHTLALLTELRDKPPTEAELSKAKRRYKWQLEAILDDTQAMCAHYGQRALLGQHGHLGALSTAIDEVTPAQVRQVARELLCASGLHVVAVGKLDRTQRKSLKRTMTSFDRRPRAARKSS